jgi:hypothetical protein
MTFSTNYREVDVNDELPKQAGVYYVLSEGNLRFEVHYSPNEDVWELGKVRLFTKDTGITHWLKIVHDSILLTREELEKIKADAWEAGSDSCYKSTKPEGDCGFDSVQHMEDKQQYISSLK